MHTTSTACHGILTKHKGMGDKIHNKQCRQRQQGNTGIDHHLGVIQNSAHSRLKKPSDIHGSTANAP
ncbi:MAG: hypothetical protein O3C21_19425, partial [Verrucomicrobia bacterium]|nr:hypothetical protein [Verrucomicrobiota bacterium]